MELELWLHTRGGGLQCCFSPPKARGCVCFAFTLFLPSPELVLLSLGRVFPGRGRVLGPAPGSW